MNLMNLTGWDKFEVKGSENYYKFESELIEDKRCKKRN